MTSESEHEKAARDLMFEGFAACDPFGDKPPCDCDPGAVDGCKARVAVIAEALAAAEARGRVKGLEQARAIIDQSGGFIDCVAIDAIAAAIRAAKEGGK